MGQVEGETVSFRELIRTASQNTQRYTIYRFATCILFHISFRDMPSVTAPCERAPLIRQQLRMRTPCRYSAASVPLTPSRTLISRTLIQQQAHISHRAHSSHRMRIPCGARSPRCGGSVSCSLRFHAGCASRSACAFHAVCASCANYAPAVVRVFWI